MDDVHTKLLIVNENAINIDRIRSEWNGDKFYPIIDALTMGKTVIARNGIIEAEINNDSGYKFLKLELLLKKFYPYNVFSINLTVHIAPNDYYTPIRRKEKPKLLIL